MDVLSIKSRRKRITFSWMIALIVTILFIINYYGTGNTNTIFCGLNLFCACISGYFALISICKNKLIYNFLIVPLATRYGSCKMMQGHHRACRLFFHLAI